MAERANCRVRATPNYASFYSSLPPSDKRRLWIEDMMSLLITNPFTGEKIKRERIPKVYLNVLKVRNLYRFRHPEGYRTVYTVLDGGSGSTPVLVEFMNHAEYEKRFGYAPT